MENFTAFTDTVTTIAAWATTNPFLAVAAGVALAAACFTADRIGRRL